MGVGGIWLPGNKEDIPDRVPEAKTWKQGKHL